MSATATQHEPQGSPKSSGNPTASTSERGSGRAGRRPVPWLVLAALVGLMLASSLAHLSALHRDLPIPDTDERAFVQPAVHMAATGDPNPHWFGHPGSTVIYPLAGLFHLWDVVAHHGPILMSNHAMTARFQRSPSEFYVIGRLWAIAFSVGTLPLLFLVGRRAFNDRVALIATAVWAVLALPVHFGRMVRTDSAGAFFGLLALLLCLRLLDEPRLMWCVLAGIVVGLAISSRYFMVSLVPVLLAAAVFPYRRRLRRAARSGGIALASVAVAFTLTTPFFWLDWHTATQSLRNENLPLFEHDGLSPLGNLRWYIGSAIPEALTWPIVALAAVGLVIVIRRHRPRQLLLVAFATIFLAGICASTLHWNHWIIQIVPVLCLLAASTVDTIVHRLTTANPQVCRASFVAPVALVVTTTLLLIHPVAELVDTSVNATTRLAARRWVVAHLRPGTGIVEDARSVGVDRARFRVEDAFDPRVGDRLQPGHHTIGDYERARYQYIVVDTAWSTYFIFSPQRFPDAGSFYKEIACHTLLIAKFDHDSLRHGPAVRIYQLGARPRRIFGPRCDQHAVSGV